MLNAKVRNDEDFTGSAFGGEAVAGTEYEGWEFSFVPDGTGVLTFRPTHRWKRRAIIGRPCGTSAAGKFSGVSGTDNSFRKILEVKC